MTAPSPTPSCSAYSTCYATDLSLKRARTDLKEAQDVIDTLRARCDELVALNGVNQSASQSKRDAETFLRLQKTEEIQRRANDSLEHENGRLRALLKKAGVDYAPLPQLTVVEEEQQNAVHTAMFG